MRLLDVMRVTAVVVATGLALASCSDQSNPPDSTRMSSTSLTPMPAMAANAEVPESECRREPPNAKIDHSLQGFSFTNGSATVSVGGLGGASHCYRYQRWGNADPAVPLDSLLFLFKGPAADGVTIDMLVGDLTAQTRVNARVAVSIEGSTFQGDRCGTTITALSNEGIAGKFTCPNATKIFGNPFAPLDDPETVPSPSSSPEKVALSGWFATSR